MECTVAYKSEVVDYVMQVVSSALGGKVTKKRPKNSSTRKTNRKIDPSSVSLNSDGFSAVESAFASMGIHVQTKSKE